MNKREEKAFETLGTEFNLALDKLSRMACPTCGAYTLEVELTVRSGARFHCRGWHRGDETAICDLEVFTKVTSPTDLPDLNEKAKVESK